MTRRLIAILAGITLILVGGSAQSQDRASEVEAKLKSMKVTLDFKNASLDTVVDYVRDLGNFNILIDKSARDKGDIQITLAVKDISLKSALALMLKSKDLTTMFKDGVLLVVSTDKEAENVITEIYDVRDLLFPIQDMPGIDIALSGGPLGTFAPPDPPSTPTEIPLVEIVKAHTGGKSWDSNPKASIKLENGILVVRQTKEIHKQIRRLLGKLGEYK